MAPCWPAINAFCSFRISGSSFSFFVWDGGIFKHLIIPISLSHFLHSTNEIENFPSMKPKVKVGIVESMSTLKTGQEASLK